MLEGNDEHYCLLEHDLTSNTPNTSGDAIAIGPLVEDVEKLNLQAASDVHDVQTSAKPISVALLNVILQFLLGMSRNAEICQCERCKGCCSRNYGLPSAPAEAIDDVEFSDGVPRTSPPSASSKGGSSPYVP